MAGDFTQMEYPFQGLSTDLARRLGMTPEDMRTEITRNPGAYNPSERMSALLAENKIRAMNRREKELPQHNISKERV